MERIFRFGQEFFIFWIRSEALRSARSMIRIGVAVANWHFPARFAKASKTRNLGAAGSEWDYSPIRAVRDRLVRLANRAGKCHVRNRHPMRIH